MAINKKNLHLVFDEEYLVELRKELFQKGINPQSFFDYIVELVSFRDERIMEVIDEAAEDRRSRVLTKEKVKPEEKAKNLYALIEQRLKEKKAYDKQD